MGDELNTDKKSSQAETSTGSAFPRPVDHIQPGVTILGSGHRIDGPHPSPASGAGTEPAELPLGNLRSRQTDQAPATFSPNDDELLLQASQIAEHLRGQLTDLNRREQGLNEQLLQLDQERRNLRLSAHQAEEEARERNQQLVAQEQELSRKFQACEKLIGDVEEQGQELEQSRQNLANDRANLKEQLSQDLNADRAELEQSRLQFSEERENFVREAEAQKQQHAQALSQIDRQLEEERLKLRDEITAEVNEEHSVFRQEKSAWLAERVTQKAAIERERNNLHDAVESTREELDRLQNEQTEQLQRQAEERVGQLRELETEHQNRLAKQKQALQAEQAKTTDEFKQQRDQLNQERSVFENRIGFQQEHLQKLRSEIEVQQHHQSLEYQQSFARLEQGETILRLRSEQLAHYRELLELREDSVRREQEIQAANRRSVDAESGKFRDGANAERETWNQERQSQLAEIRRQQDMLTLHAENLEGRKTRLDQLRTELEETHRETLEMRIAVEEAFAQITQTAGSGEIANERVEQARTAMSEHYSQLREAISSQRKELLESQSSLQQQSDEFNEERQKLTEWIAERSETLQHREATMSGEASEIDTRRAQLAAEHESQLAERIEAEQVIRGLLKQISELTEADDHSIS